MYSAYSLAVISHVCALCTGGQLMLIVQSSLEAVPTVKGTWGRVLRGLLTLEMFLAVF